MSSRSFRRRSNRRRHRPQGGPETPGQRQPGSPEEHPSRGEQPAGAASRGGPGQRRDQRPGHRGPPRQPEQKPRPEVPLVFPDCPVCGKPVRELASALTHRVSRVPAHFDCVVRELRDSNEMNPQEKLCYLGGGTFGILEFRPSGGPSRFVIKKRIPYEEKEAPQDWKKPLQITC